MSIPNGDESISISGCAFSYSQTREPRIKVGFKKIEDGSQMVDTAIDLTREIYLPGKPEQQAREGLAVLRSAMNWLEDTQYFEDAHQALDRAGRKIRLTFGCSISFSPKDGYSQKCPVALAHNRVGCSVGIIVKKSECSICGTDPADCEHISGYIYGDQQCYRIITECELLEISLVSRPQNPDARLNSIGITNSELREIVGPEFKYGMQISCDYCLNKCPGIFEFEMQL